jgi:aminoglycoside phosphotransferase (APT) family kinase protein
MNMSTSAGFDTARLDAFLRDVIPGLSGSLDLHRIRSGQSNPTFFVSFGNRRLVVRKQPPGPLLGSAHAIDREFRVMRALEPSGVPIPKVVLYHDAPDVIGTPFYVMERVEGRVFSDCTLPGVDVRDRREMYFAMADTLKLLHAVDWAGAGLADFGRPGDYFQRQVRRWTQQWQNAKPREIPELSRLVEWLPANIPAEEVTTIAHGDFRIGNLMFHSTEPRVVAVLDWELSTLGHPLADLAYSALAWRLGPDEYMGMRGCDLTSLGIPREQEYVARYGELAGSGPLRAFHFAFALFRLAVIFEGIRVRAELGNASSTDAESVGRLGPVFARRAIEILDSSH